MNKVLLALVGASALTGSVAGFAGGPDAYAPPADSVINTSAGFYLTGNVGYGHYDIGKSDIDGLKVDRNSFAWSANVGYKFNPYIALEAGYMELPYAKISGSALSGANNVKLRTHAVTLVAKGIYPINEEFDLFGKAGLAYEIQSGQINANGSTVTVTNHHHHVAPLFGLGVDYNITQNWSVGLQGITTLKTGNEFPATYTGLVGVTYKFS